MYSRVDSLKRHRKVHSKSFTSPGNQNSTENYNEQPMPNHQKQQSNHQHQHPKQNTYAMPLQDVNQNNLSVPASSGMYAIILERSTVLSSFSDHFTTLLSPKEVLKDASEEVSIQEIDAASQLLAISALAP